MAFLETPRFPEDISEGATVGPSFQTSITVNDGGYEQRNSRWQDSLHEFDVGHGVKTQAQLDVLKSFFINTQGMRTAFRFKDWSDYDVSTSESDMTYDVGGAFQLGKVYTTGALTKTRALTKIVDSGYTIYRDAVLQTEGAGAGEYAIDTTTGIVTFQPDTTGAISGVTQANPGVVTATGHGRTTGDELEFTSVGGMTELHGQTVTITVIDPNSYSIGIDTTAYTAYTSGGQWEYYPQSSEAMTWAGEFDVPVRFASDSMRVSIDLIDHFTWGQIPLIEVR